jgi:hypothetical protein
VGSDHCIDCDPDYYRIIGGIMKTVITLSHHDIIDVLQGYAAQLVRVDFTPNDIKLDVKVWGSNEWTRGEARLSIEVEAATEEFN